MAPDLLAEPEPLGRFGPPCRIARGDHRIVPRQAPLSPVFFRGKAEAASQVALQHLQVHPVFQTDEVVRLDRLRDWNRRLSLGSRSRVCEAGERTAHQLDDLRHLADCHVVVCHVRADNARRPAQKIFHWTYIPL